MVKKNKITFIAEAAQGHEGKLSNIKKYVLTSKKIGVDFLKFHIIFADELANRDYRYYKFFKKLEITKKGWNKISNYAKKNKVKLAFDVLGLKSLGIAKLCNAKLIKIHSTDIYNYPLQKKINNSKIKSVILSVSGCKEKEIKKAVLNLKDKNLTLMYGYQNYPTISNKLNISKINKLKRKYNYYLGYADHSSSGILETIYNCSTAISNGVTFIEKHLTYNKNLKIEDDESAIGQNEFINLIKIINLCKYNNGIGSLNLDSEEQKYRNNVSRSFFSKRNIKKNENFNFDNIEIIRAKKSNTVDINILLRSKARVNIKKKTLINSKLLKKK